VELECVLLLRPGNSVTVRGGWWLEMGSGDVVLAGVDAVHGACSSESSSAKTG
jgi:hypothetical protein